MDEDRTEAGSTVLVFVHGGVHTGRCWDDTIAAIHSAAPGMLCLAVDMPGRRGIPGDLSSLDIAECVESVVDQIRNQFATHRTKVVLVGHSLAGVVLPGIANRLGARRVEHVVFVACCVPPPGNSVADTLGFPLNRIVGWVIGRSSVISRIPPGVVRIFFANRTSRAHRAVIRDSLCAESSALLMEIPTASLPAAVRRSWVLPSHDRALRPAVQRGFIRAMGGVDDVVTIEAGHEVMVTHAGQLAAAILRLVLAEAPSQP